MTTLRSVILLAVVTLATQGGTAAEPQLRGMPEELQGMPPKSNQAAQEIQGILASQKEMIEKASQAKTPAEREAIFQAIAGNVQAIAQKRVIVLEHYSDRAKARTEWARKHAATVHVSDLTEAMREFAQQGPRSPFVDQTKPPKHANDPPHAKLPDKVLDARSRLKETVRQLETLVQRSEQARTDEQRREIKQEISEHLKAIEKERVAILEAIEEVSQQRLTHAKQRAKAAGVPSAVP